MTTPPIVQSPADLPYAQLVIKLLGQVQAVDGAPVNINISSEKGRLLSLRGWMVVALGSESSPPQVNAGLCVLAEGRFALIQPSSVRLFDTPGDLYTYAVALTPAESLERRIWKTACLRFPLFATCEGSPRTVSS